MENYGEISTEEALSNIVMIRGIDHPLNDKVTDALKAHIDSVDGFDLDHSLYLAHFWQQAVESDSDNPNVVLVPHDPYLQNSGEFAGEPGSWELIDQIAKSSVKNIGQFNRRFAEMVEDQRLVDVLSRKSLVVATNHQSYLNPAEIAYGLSRAIYNVSGQDFRPNTNIILGPRITTTKFGGLDLPELTTQFSNWQLVVPDTTRGQIPGDERLTSKVNRGTARSLLRTMSKPGNILIVAPSGTKDAEDGSYRDCPTDASIGLVSPSARIASMPIAIGDRGFLENMSIGKTTKVKVEFGPLIESDSRKPDTAIGSQMVHDVLYGQLVPEIEQSAASLGSISS